MSIMNIFKTATQSTASNNPPQQQQQQQPSGQTQGKENLSDNPPTVDNKGQIPGTSPNAENPLDVYAKMFENANKNSNTEAPKFALDPKVLGDVSKKMDFTRGVDPELLQKATSGDVNSLLEVIRNVGQNSYRAAIEHSTALTDNYLNTRSDFERKNIETGVRQQLTNSALSSNPNYQHPVIKQELNRVASQFAAANPDANPQEIAQAAKKYIDDLYSALNPSSGKSKESAQQDEMDWTQYLSGN